MSVTTLFLADLDEAARPRAPKIEGLTDRQRQLGSQLRAYHRYHLRELVRVEAAIREVEAQRAPATSIQAEIDASSLSRNLRAFGNLCGRGCQLLEMHHMAEDTRIFPALMGKTPGLDRVVEKLAREHLVIVAALDALERDAALLSRTGDPADFPAVRTSFEALSAVVVSHFGYEENEIGDAIGFYAAAA